MSASTVSEPRPTDVRQISRGRISRFVRGFAAFAGALALVAGALCLGWKMRLRPMPAFGLPPDHPREFGDFQLTERSGRLVRREELRGKICVVSFVFTSCGISCLQVSRNLQHLQERLGRDADDVRMVSLSIDPRTDTPAVLSRFAAGFSADPERWLFLTGEPDDLERLIDTSFLPRTPYASKGPLPGVFLGTGRVFLVDAHGRVRGYFDGLDPATVDAVYRSIGGLRAERSRS
jgi:protein SCO1/2